MQLRRTVTGRRTADDDWEPAQLRAAQLLDRCIERVEVEVDDRSVCHERVSPRVGSAAGVLPPLINVRLTHVACANHQLHAWNGEMRRRATQPPRRWIVLVLVDALIELDPVQTAQ